MSIGSDFYGHSGGGEGVAQNVSLPCSSASGCWRGVVDQHIRHCHPRTVVMDPIEACSLLEPSSFRRLRNRIQSFIPSVQGGYLFSCFRVLLLMPVGRWMAYIWDAITGYNSNPMRSCSRQFQNSHPSVQELAQ